MHCVSSPVCPDGSACHDGSMWLYMVIVAMFVLMWWPFIVVVAVTRCFIHVVTVNNHQ